MKTLHSLTARDWLEFAALMGLVVALPIYGEVKGIPLWVSFPAMLGLAHLLPFRKITS